MQTFLGREFVFSGSSNNANKDNKMMTTFLTLPPKGRMATTNVKRKIKSTISLDIMMSSVVSSVIWSVVRQQHLNKHIGHIYDCNISLLMGNNNRC